MIGVIIDKLKKHKDTVRYWRHNIRNNAVIMPNISIGNNMIIVGDAIVTKNIPDNSIAVGIPARVIESIDEYCVKHAKDFLHTFNMRGSEKAKMFIQHLNNEAGSGDMK